MTTIIYFLIGILLAFLFCVLLKSYNKYKRPKFMERFRNYDEMDTGIMAIALIVVWPVILSFLTILGLVLLMFVAIFWLGEKLVKVFNRIINKIIK